MMRLLFVVAMLIAAPSAAKAEVVRVIREPQVGVVSRATVGSSVLDVTAATIPIERGVILDRDVAFGPAKEWVLPKGSFLRAGQRPERLRACTIDGDRCLTDTDGDGSFDSAWQDLGDYSETLSSAVPFLVSNVERPSVSDQRQSLIFEGKDGNTLRLAYREFRDGVARSAFDHNLAFTISGVYPTTISFRDVRITVLGIDNSGIRYRIEP